MEIVFRNMEESLHRYNTPKYFILKPEDVRLLRSSNVFGGALVTSRQDVILANDTVEIYGIQLQITSSKYTPDYGNFRQLLLFKCDEMDLLKERLTFRLQDED